MRCLPLLLCLSLLALPGLSGCSGPAGCRVDVECGGGLVCADGQCLPSRGQSDASSELDSGPRADMAQPGAPDGFSADALTNGCPFNMDGIIQRAEIPAMPGLGGFFEATQTGTTATVDVKKHSGTWDFSAVGASDEKVFDGLTSPTGAWWATSFPDASYAQLLDASSGLLGVYKIEDTRLRLLGAVSATSGFGSTNVKYDPPIDVLRFPLSSTSTWTVSTTLSGTASGIGFYATETWGFKVDDSGTVKTPAATFPSLRLRVDYEQVYGFSVSTRISYLFITECYGTIARIRSNSGETSGDFTQASEYRRLAAP